MDLNIAFSRNLLAQITPEIRAAGFRVMKDSWVYGYPNDQWEFHGPNGFYWIGRASNAYEARYDGWSAWLRQQKESKEENK